MSLHYRILEFFLIHLKSCVTIIDETNDLANCGNTSIDTQDSIKKDGRNLPGHGWAAYKLILKINRAASADNLNEKLALRLPRIYTSCRVLINGTICAEKGFPADSSEKTIEKYEPVLVLLPDADVFEIILHFFIYSK